MISEIFQPVFVVVILRINTNEQSIALKAVEGLQKISGSSAATKLPGLTEKLLTGTKTIKTNNQSHQKSCKVTLIFYSARL